MTSASLKRGSPFLALLLVGTLGVLGGCSSEQEPQAVAGTAKADKLTQCIKPTAFMRRNHMELILHQRTITVHEGIRATKDSLAGCIDCHVRYDAHGKPVPVNAEGQFCDTCHEKLAVHLDCFQCHSPVPNGPQPPNAVVSQAADRGITLAQVGGEHGSLPQSEQEKGN